MEFRIFAMIGLISWCARLWLNRYEGFKNTKIVVSLLAIIFIVMSFIEYARY